MKYISKGIVLDEEMWAAFNRVREVHGSYNKALRFVLSAGGVFESPREVPAIEHKKAQRRAAVTERAPRSTIRPPLLKPGEKKLR